MTVGAALKRLLVTVLLNEKNLKRAGIAVGSVILAIFLPVLALFAVLGSVDWGSPEVRDAVLDNLSQEVLDDLSSTDTILTNISEAMSTADLSGKADDAQILYLLALSDHAADPDFPQRLAGCFAEGQTDEELIAAINLEFATHISADDFSTIMHGIRSVALDGSHLAAPDSKNNLDLVVWAEQAEAAGWGYVWGTNGAVLTEARLSALITQYPSEVGGKEDFIRANWLGKRTADCSGLIRSYLWYDPEGGEISMGYHGIPGLTANGMYNLATEKGVISTIPEIPGLAVWHSGHIGVYVGGGEVVEAMSTNRGVVRTRLENRSWTHWLKIPYLNYVEPWATPHNSDFGGLP